MIRSVLGAVGLILMLHGAAVAMDLLGVGQVITPSSEALAIRNAPPGFFQGSGTAIGEARKGEKFRILERKSIPTVVGRDEWLRVQNVADPRETGWITGASARANRPNVMLAE
jgi:hypothetical protein